MLSSSSRACLVTRLFAAVSLSPAGLQLRTLQALLSDIASGKVNQISHSFGATAIQGGNKSVKLRSREWKERIASTYVWLVNLDRGFQPMRTRPGSHILDPEVLNPGGLDLFCTRGSTGG